MIAYDWDETRPGALEIDLVEHNGGSPLGPPLNPSADGFLRPRSARQRLGLRDDLRLGLIIRMLTDHRFLDVRGGLMVRFDKAGQQAHGMSA
jgi:hypothetical protein